MTNRTPCAFVVQRHRDHGPWEITPVYPDDWHSDMSCLYVRGQIVYCMGLYCEQPLEHLVEGDHELNCSLRIDGEADVYLHSTRIAFSTEEAARTWIAEHGQPTCVCHDCEQTVSIRRPKNIYEGWLDVDEMDKEDKDLVSDHAHNNTPCTGSGELAAKEI